MKTTKTTFYKVIALPIVFAVFSVSVSPVFADFEDIFSGSPSVETVFSGSPSYETVYSGSPSYETVFSGSPSYENIFSGSPSYETVYSGSPSYETVYSGSPSYETVYSGSPSYETVYSGSPSYTYTPGYTYTTDTTYTSWTGYTTPSYSYTPTYTSPTYNYVTPTYTTPTYVTPIYTPVTPVVPVTPVTPVTPPVVPVTPITYCSDGALPSPITGCTRTTTIPVTTTTVCADGLAPINGSCVRTVVTPTVTYQTCWDGLVIPLYSICPAQYKTCANGTSVPVNQQCYYAPTPVPYVPPVTIKFNNAITSVTTEITKSSARCNGIGLVAVNAPSTGWFEYGETANLGRETGKAAIGSSPTAPFSNVLVNLKPSTAYYCRAVMQNQYGTVKGEIVSFRTKATTVAYVKPVTKTTVKKTTTATKPVAKKAEIICIDGTVVSTGSRTSANLLNEGQKLISLQLEKVSGNLAPGAVVNYRIGFKNLSDEALKNVTIKVTIPQEVTFMQASSGTYDASTRTLTTTIPSLPAGADGSIGWTGTVAGDAQIGKPLATTGYAGYTVPGTDVQDEVTAYTVGAIVPAAAGSADTGAKKVVGATGAERGFLPNSLVEWLALVAIIFIIFVLARSVYSSYQDDKGKAH